MVDFTTLAQEHAGTPDEELKKAGQAIGGQMGDEHTAFLKHVTGMIQRNEIDYRTPASILNKGNYDQLSEAERAQVDVAMVNIVDLLRHITDFYLSKQTPDASPQLETMIEQLWQMKSKVEAQYGDVFKL